MIADTVQRLIGIAARSNHIQLVVVGVLASPIMVLFGCGGSSSGKAPGKDAGADVAADAHFDALQDGRLDDGSAAQPEASVDAGPDAATSRLSSAQIGEPELIATGFGLAESPLWDHCRGRLLFTDVTGGNETGTIHTADADGHVGVLATDTSNANGIAFDTDGSLILAQMGGDPGHIARRSATGMIEVLEPAGSPRLHTPDDVVVRSDGTIYFSDGDFFPIGSLLGFDDELPVYMLPPGGGEMTAVATVSGPNGVELSPDEKTFYVSAYGAGTIVAYDVAEDGTLSGGRPVLSGLTSPDSLCLDAEGNLYVGVSEGLQVSRPDGELVTLIPIATTAAFGGTTNCTFGGENGRTLFITSFDSLYKVEGMPIAGLDWGVNQDRQRQCPPVIPDAGADAETPSRDGGAEGEAASTAPVDAGADAGPSEAGADVDALPRGPHDASADADG